MKYFIIQTMNRNYLSTVVQSNAMFIPTEQSLCFSRKQAVLFHLQSAQVIKDVTHSTASGCYQVNAYESH